MRGHLHLAGAHDDPSVRPIRVVLAEEHVAMRRTLRLLLEGEERVRVVSEAGDLPAAISQLHDLRPDVLVLDLRQPNGSGMDTIRELHEQAPRTAIVLLTMHDSFAFARRALDAGASGFVLKDTADAELPEAVRLAASGSQYTSPRLHPGAGPLGS